MSAPEAFHSREAEIPTTEIERKFLLPEFPTDISDVEPTEIRQGYLVIDHMSHSAVRLRQQDEKYFMTYKSGEGLVRDELEEEISAEFFEKYWPVTEGRRIEKRRHEFQNEDGDLFQIDEYYGELEGLVTAEVEFQNENAAGKFIPPHWLGDEITTDFRYSNASLAEHGIPERYLELEAGIDEVVRKAATRLDQAEGENIVLSIAGGSASGKSFHAKTIGKRLGEIGINSVAISGDNYYIPDENIEERVSSGLPNWDVPQAIDFEEWKKDLKKLKQGVPIAARANNFDGKGGIITEGEIGPRQVIIAEGLHALNDSMRDIGDVKVFFNVTPHGRLIRRLTRDIHRTPMQGSEIMKYIAGVVDPTHEQHVEVTKINADVIVNNDYSPEKEFSGGTYTQEKFKTEDIRKNLEAKGAEYIAATTQIDRYFQPKEVDFHATGESIRIRTEGGKNVFGYKGPQLQEFSGNTRKRIEVLLDDDTTEVLERKYGESIRIVRKERVLYELNGVSIAVDTNVETEENGRVTNLGNFIELRSSLEDVEEAKNDIHEIRKRLGISTGIDPILTSYVAMQA